MNLTRYDALCSRVCASVPFSLKSPCQRVPGGQFDPTWTGPRKDRPAAKVWHWPIQASPVLLRTFPDVATTDPTIAKVLARAAQINAALTATNQYARTLASHPDALTGLAARVYPNGKRLRAHQARGILNTLASGGSRALFHQTGTGKTITAGTLLEALVRAVDGFRVGVVVCPVTLIDAAWTKDLRDWFPDLPFLSLRDHDKGADREMAVAAAVRRHGRVVVLTNYEGVRTDPSIRRVLAGAYVVIDECSKAKGFDSAISVCLREVACTFRGVVLLSGTPAPNGNHEYWPHAKVLAPAANYDAFPGGISAFNKEFCRVKRFDKASDPCKGCGAPKREHDRGNGCGAFVGAGHYGGHTFDEAQAAKLHERLSPVCEWVRKEDCLDLPPKSYIDVPIALEPATARAYREMRDDMVVELGRKYATEDDLRAHAQNALVQLLKLRQITAGFIPAQKDEWLHGGADAPKVMVPLGREKIDWLLEHVETDSERIVLWTQFIFEVARYMKELRGAKVKCENITGDTKVKDRAGIFEGFVAGDFQVLVAHPGVAQWGVSFPGVSQAAYGSLSYALQEYAQSQDRIHGIGRGDPNKRSTFYRLVAYADGEPTIDQAVIDALDGKRELLELVFQIDKDRRARGFVPRDLGAKING